MIKLVMQFRMMFAIKCTAEGEAFIYNGQNIFFRFVFFAMHFFDGQDLDDSNNTAVVRAVFFGEISYEPIWNIL